MILFLIPFNLKKHESNSYLANLKCCLKSPKCKLKSVNFLLVQQLLQTLVKIHTLQLENTL